MSLWKNPCSNCGHIQEHPITSNCRQVDCTCQLLVRKPVEHLRYMHIAARQIILTAGALLILIGLLLIGIPIWGAALIWALVSSLALLHNLDIDRPSSTKQLVEAPHEGGLAFNLVMLCFAPLWLFYIILFNIQHSTKAYQLRAEEKIKLKEHPLPGSLKQAEENLNKINQLIGSTGITPELQLVKDEAEKALSRIQEIPILAAKDAAKVVAANVLKQTEELNESIGIYRKTQVEQLHEGHAEQLAYLSEKMNPQIAAKSRAAMTGLKKDDLVYCVVCNQEYPEGSLHDCPKEMRQ